MKTQTFDKIRHAIFSQLKHETLVYELHSKLAKLIADKWENKKTNRRIVEQLRAILIADGAPNPIVFYEVTGTGVFQDTKLKVWNVPAAPDFEHRIMFFIGNVGNSVRFEAENQSTGSACFGRCHKRKVMLQTGAELSPLADRIDAYKLAKEQLEKSMRAVGDDSYAVEHAVELRSY